MLLMSVADLRPGILCIYHSVVLYIQFGLNNVGASLEFLFHGFQLNQLEIISSTAR